MVRVTWLTNLGELHQDLEQERAGELLDALRKLGFEPQVANLPAT